MTTTTYAFGVLEDNRKEVRGTQGWSVQMALQLDKKVFVYDEQTSHTTRQQQSGLGEPIQAL